MTMSIKGTNCCADCGVMPAKSNASALFSGPAYQTAT